MVDEDEGREVARLARVLDGREEEAALDAAERLFELGTPGVWPLLVRRLVRADPETELYELLIEGLAAAGAHPVPALLEALGATRGQARFALLEVLSRCGVRDERIYAALLELLGEDAFQGAVLLTAYGDARAAVPLGEVLDAYPLAEDVADVFAQQTVLELERALRTLGGGLDGARREKVLTARRLRDAWNRTFERWRDAVEQERRRALGRNEPCWCGSGVKYKRCHLGGDRARRA